MLSGQPDLMRAFWSDTRDMGEAEANRYFARQAMRYVAAHPADELLLMARKAFYTLTAIRPELPLTSSRNIVGIASNVITFVLATLGIAALWQDRERASQAGPFLLILLPLVLTSVLAILIGPIGMRYRIAIDGVVWMFAGLGVLRIVDGRRDLAGKRSAHRA
jgi:membrane glycosyltransferase